MFTVEVRLPVAGTVEPTAAYGSARRPDREPHPAGYAVGVVLAESQPRRAGGEQPAEPDQDEVRCDLIRGGSGYPAAGGIRKAGSPSAGRRAAFWLFRCPYSLLKSITPPAMTMIRPATTATVGWLALEGKITCVPPIKMRAPAMVALAGRSLFTTDARRSHVVRVVMSSYAWRGVRHSLRNFEGHDR